MDLNKINEIKNKYKEDSDQIDFEIAKYIFELEEGREANLNNRDELLLISGIQKGLEISRIYLHN